jgi:REP element-mobilizing transposase RayT
MRTLLALGNGHWPEPRTSDNLWPLRRGSKTVQGVAALHSCRRHDWKLASHEVAGNCTTKQCVPQGTPEKMPATHLSLHFHIVFSTKDRHPFIADEWCARLHEYLGGLVRAADGIPEAIGGTADHVHLLVGLRAMHSLAPFVQDIKQTSSRWIHETIGVNNFAWQPGYGAFTVSVSNCGTVKEYIANQADHHRTKTFREEYVAFLQKHQIDYDEKYLW